MALTKPAKPSTGTDAAAAASGGIATGTSEEPLVVLWNRLARPFSTPETVDALLGLSPTVVRQFIGAIVATSDEAEDLLDGMNVTIRSLATSMITNAERCMGDIRGPILWSETMAARASSNGAEDIFVCLTPSRAYDITENRVLVAALNTVWEAARDARIVSEKAYDDPTLRAAHAAGEAARRYLQHPSLRSVTVQRPHPRDIKRTRTSKKKASYAPALAMLERADDPIRAEDLVPFCDRRTRAQHRVLLSFVEKLEAQGGRLPDFRAEGGILYAGPLQYHHPRTQGNVSQMSGLLIGNLLVDVPDRLRERSRSRAEEDLRARSHGRETMVIMSREDVDRAFELAVSLARR